MSDKKTDSDPEIPDEIRTNINAPKRPGGFNPISPEADGNAPLDEPRIMEKDLSGFFAQLAEVLKSGKFYRLETVEREVKKWDIATKSHEYIREKRNVKVEVDLSVGADGLPFVSTGTSIDETRRVRSLVYKDAPAMNAGLGDLTPAFVEWLYLNHPYDAAVRYFGRSTHVQSWALAHSV